VRTTPARAGSGRAPREFWKKPSTSARNLLAMIVDP
jgi:hypothetical protein